MPITTNEDIEASGGTAPSGTGGFIGTPSPIAPTTAGTNDAGKTVAGKVQNNPVFKNLPRNLQIKIENGEMSLGEALQIDASASTPGASTPIPKASKPEQFAPQPMNATDAEGMGVQTQDPVAASSGPKRLSAGQVLEGGRAGKETFARPGNRGYRAFADQEFNPFLLRPEAGAGGAKLTVRDALRAGDVGRRFIGGGNTGYLPGTNGSVFRRDLIGG